MLFLRHAIGKMCCNAVTFRTDLGVAPLCDALPAEEVTTGGGGGVSPLLQTQDAAGSFGAGAVCVLRTEGHRVQH